MKENTNRIAPFLLGGTLLFWGWQSQLLLAGVLMAIILEGSRRVQTRWDFSDRDFNRVWTFCTLLLLGITVYAFSANEGPSHFGGFFQHPDLRTERGVGTTTAKTMAQVIRWLPMIFFLFMAAQRYSTRGAIPLETVSLILRWQWKKAKKLGQPLPARRNIDVTYIYFALCLMAASVHASEDTTFFWGLCALVAWALWPHGSRNKLVWVSALVLVTVAGYFGQGALGRVRIYLEGFNPAWLTNWPRRGSDPRVSKTALGQVGRIKGSSKIVIRLEPKENSHPPALLREASYLEYKATEWRARSSSENWDVILHDKQENTFTLVPGKSNLTAVNIACYLERPTGLLPLPEGCSKVENLSIYTMKKNSAGAVLVEGPGLVIFDAYYGPGETLDGPPKFPEDTSVKDWREAAALDQVIEQHQLIGETREKTLQKVMGFFESNFSYSIWQDRPILKSAEETPLTRFLLRTHKGHCEYFATATVLLLRELGIPARYAVGYAVHEASGKKYVVRQRDAHAWCIVWNDDKQIWEDFDTTPGSWLAAEEKQASPLQFLSDAWSGLVFQLSRLRWGQTHLREYILAGLTPVLAILLYQILSRGRKRNGGKDKRDALFRWPGLDSEFYELERRLHRKGMLRESSEPLGKWLHRAAQTPTFTKVGPPLEKILSLHYRYRFDPKGLSALEREALRRDARECLARLDHLRE